MFSEDILRLQLSATGEMIVSLAELTFEAPGQGNQENGGEAK